MTASSAPPYKSADEWVAGNPLRKWREAANVSQREAASRLNVTENTVHTWEHGKRVPSPESMSALVNVTGDRNLPTRWHEWHSAKKQLGINWL